MSTWLILSFSHSLILPFSHSLILPSQSGVAVEFDEMDHVTTSLIGQLTTPVLVTASRSVFCLSMVGVAAP